MTKSCWLMLLLCPCRYVVVAGRRRRRRRGRRGAGRRRRARAARAVRHAADPRPERRRHLRGSQHKHVQLQLRIAIYYHGCRPTWLPAALPMRPDALVTPKLNKNGEAEKQ